MTFATIAQLWLSLATLLTLGAVLYTLLNRSTPTEPRPSTRYDLKIEEWEAEEKDPRPYWGEEYLDDEESDARWDWEYLERAYREIREGVKQREALTGKSLELAESCGGPWLDLSQRSYTAAELHEVIVNCLRTAEEETVRDLIPTVPERYFDLPFDLDKLEDLYETLWILMDNPQWEGENPSECWPRTSLNVTNL